MWRKSEVSKLKSSPGASSSLDPSSQHPGAAGPSDSSTAPAAVGLGIKIEGKISGQGNLFFDGEFEGSIRLADGTFTVGPNARITAEIEAREIIVRGEVIGSLKASERVHIWSTGKLTGDLDSRGIMIEDGAVLHSKVAVPQPVPQTAACEVASPEASPEALPEASPKAPPEALREALHEKDQPPQPSTAEPPPLAKGAAAG